MTGRRVDVEPHLYEPGDYGSWGGTWYCRPPWQHDALGNLDGHTVVEHLDRTISVTPSILITRPGLGQWHGFLTYGVWREC